MTSKPSDHQSLSADLLGELNRLLHLLARGRLECLMPQILYEVGHVPILRKAVQSGAARTAGSQVN